MNVVEDAKIHLFYVEHKNPRKFATKVSPQKGKNNLLTVLQISGDFLIYLKKNFNSLVLEVPIHICL